MNLLKDKEYKYRENKKCDRSVYATTFDRTLIKSYVSCEKISVLLVQLTVTAHEAINTTGSINKLALTCIEWVRCA